MIYQIPVDQITGLAKYGLALSCTAVSDLAESDLARYAPPSRYFSHLIAVRSGEAHRLAAGDAAAGAQGDGRRDIAAARRAARQEPHARAPRVAAQGADRLRRPQAAVRVSKNINEPNLSAASLR